jgi:hypothetical protein
MKTPYKTKTGIQIGCNYHPVVNYHNPDQDWIQKISLGERTFWTAETVVMGIIWLLVAYAIAGLLSACGSNNLPPATYSYANSPVVPIVLESKAEQLSRQQVINGINDCETNSMRAVVVTSKRIVGGFSSDIPIDVQCYPRRSMY